MQNKKKMKSIKKAKGNKRNRGQQKFSKNQPAARKEEKTEANKRAASGNDKISKAINKNIEKTMMERAVTSKETFKYLK